MSDGEEARNSGHEWIECETRLKPRVWEHLVPSCWHYFFET